MQNHLLKFKNQRILSGPTEYSVKSEITIYSNRLELISINNISSSEVRSTLIRL